MKIQGILHLLKRHPLLSILTAIGFFLRAYAIGRNSLWMDEIRQVGYYYSAENVFHLIYKAATQQQPPLDYLIGYIIGNFLPFHETVVRLPSLIFGTACIPASYYLFKLVYNKRAALLTAFLFSFSPSLIAYSQEARPYSIFSFLLISTLILFFHALKDQNFKTFKNLKLIAFLTLLSRGLEPILALASLVLTSLMLWKPLTGEEWRNLRTSILVRNLIKSLGLSLLWFSPFFIFIISKSKQYLAIAQPGILEKQSFDFIQPITYLLQASLPGTLPKPFSLFVSLSLGGAAVVFARRKDFPRAFYLFLYFLLFMLIHTYVFHYSVNSQLAQLAPKYLLYSHIVFLGFSAIFLDQMITRTEKFSPKCANGLTGAIISGFIFLQWPAVKANYLPYKVDYRAAGHFLSQNLSYGDVILHVSFLPFGAMEHGFWGEGLYYKTRAPIYGLPELVKAIRKAPQERKRIFVAIHETPNLPFALSPQLNEFTANSIKIIHLKREIVTENWQKELIILIDELEMIFPKDNGARAKLFLAKCQLLRQTDDKLANSAFDEAKKIVPSLNIIDSCP